MRAAHPIHLRRYAGLFCAAAVLLIPAASWSVEKPPPPGPSSQIRFPLVSEARLDNGLRVEVAPRHEVPLVAAVLLIPGGSSADPNSRPGVAQMTADLLTQGTQRLSAQQMARAIDDLGASLDASAGWDSVTVSVSATAPQFPKSMALMAESVLSPAFRPEELERRRTRALSDLQATYSDPDSLASLVLARVMYGAQPYGHPAAGTPASVRAITRDDLVSYHTTRFIPQGATLVLGGDITPKAGIALASRLFGGWKGQGAGPALPDDVTASKAPQARVVVIDKPDAGRAAIALGRPVVARRDPLFYSGILANEVLTGYSGRLNWEIRVKRGLSYGAGSGLDARRLPGPFLASTMVENAKAPEGVQVMLQTVQSLGKQPVPATELTPRRERILGRYARRFEETGSLVATLAGQALYGLPTSEVMQYRQRLLSVTAEQVQRFAETYLSGGMEVVVVGDASKFLPALKQAHPDLEVIKDADLDLGSPGLTKGGD
ncbi:MAG TPA: pitrilysin family protein [Armatimonadota bacterium]|jgi:zinc protease